MSTEVFILGGAQSDFARNIDREGGGMFELFRDVSEAAFAATGIEPKDVETAHVGNFVGELFAGQDNLVAFSGMSMRILLAFRRRGMRRLARPAALPFLPQVQRLRQDDTAWR